MIFLIRGATPVTMLTSTSCRARTTLALKGLIFIVLLLYTMSARNWKNHLSKKKLSTETYALMMTCVAQRGTMFSPRISMLSEMTHKNSGVMTFNA